MNSHIERAIRDAVEKGGYRRVDCDVVGDLDYYLENTGCSEIFLDPAFWQALDRARGWEDAKDEIFHGVARSGWYWHWHRFIDHLAANKDAESFFADLNSSQSI